MNFKDKLCLKRMLSYLCMMSALSGLVYAVPDQPQTYQIRAVAMDIVGENNVLWIRTGVGKDPVKIELNTRIFSEPVKYKGPKNARFYKSENDAKAEEPGKPIATVKLTEPKSLILFQPDRSATHYTSYAVAEARFPFGSFQVINFSKAKVAVEMGNKKSLILAGKAKNFAFKNGGKPTPVSIVAWSTVTGKPRYVRRSSWSIAPTQRELVILVPNPINGLVQARHFVDTKVEKE